MSNSLCKVLVSLLLAFSGSAASQECPGAHCSAKSDQINAICKANGQAGNLVFVEHPPGSGAFCYCRCSCLPPSTLVAVADGKWEHLGNLKVGNTVLTLNRSGKWESSPVVFSDGTSQPQKPIPYAIYILLKNGTALITTADHLFLLSDGQTLRRADRIQPEDKLLNAATMQPIDLVQISAGSYHGPMHNIAASSWKPGEEKWGHLINTQGVISGDYYAQINLSDEKSETLLQVGSDGYLARYSGRSELTNLNQEIKLENDAKFVPYKKLQIPKDAIPFLEPGNDVARKGALYSLDYTIPYEMADYLTKHYKRFYPQIEFQIDWANDTVNAFAWMSNGKRHVALLGGLLRHRAIQQEGAGLVLSHEIGHHYGGVPRYPSGNQWASCEGQSDYWGASVAQRNVWWGNYALEQTSKGASQLYDLFANGLMVGNLIELGAIAPAERGLCTHPPARCRFETFNAANQLDPKPACAGDPPSLQGLPPN